MLDPEGFQQAHFEELTVSVRNVELCRSVDHIRPDVVADEVTGTAVLDTDLVLIGQDYPPRKRAQGIGVTLGPYEDTDELQRRWASDRKFFLESVTTRERDVQFSDSMQELLKGGRTAAADFDDEPPTAKIYYTPADYSGPPGWEERWGIYCRISRSVFSELANDIRSGLPISLEVRICLNPLFESRDRFKRDQVSLGLLPYSAYGFASLGWLFDLVWIIKSRRARVGTNSGDSVGRG